MRILRFMAAVLVFAASVSIVYAQTQTAALDTPNFSGSWKGWCQGCQAGDFILSLQQSPTGITGTVKVQGASSSFGEDPVPIRNVKIDGRKIKFESGHPDAPVFYVTLTLSEDGRSLVGDGQYRKSFGLRFRREQV